jgi:hypothetical protein
MCQCQIVSDEQSQRGQRGDETVDDAAIQIHISQVLPDSHRPQTTLDRQTPVGGHLRQRVCSVRRRCCWRRSHSAAPSPSIAESRHLIPSRGFDRREGRPGLITVEGYLGERVWLVFSFAESTTFEPTRTMDLASPYDNLTDLKGKPPSAGSWFGVQYFSL